MLAEHLQWHLLDSGALYRVLALAAKKNQIDLEEITELTELGKKLDVKFNEKSGDIFLDSIAVTTQIRTEECGADASIVAAVPSVREALHMRQRAFKAPPGLIADGRDMGTVVFPEAELKLFLEASPLERAKRRQLQLKAQGFDGSLDDLFAEISRRDERDRKRAVSPLVPAKDAIVVDTTQMGIQEVFKFALLKAEQRGLIKK